VRIPQSFIEEILSKIDILDIIEPRLTLKKTSKNNFLGLCPFHQEKTPSFSVSQTKQFYYCFGCKASGNAIGFLMAYDKLLFQEAVSLLADKVGMPLPTVETPQNDYKNLYELLEQCCAYYERQLPNNPDALKYLQERGLSPEIIKRFRLGFAPADWHNLQNYSKGSNKQKFLLEVGMLATKKTNETYDRFRHRVMFPIRNRKGQIIAFGGRSLGNALPKYLNSPETKLFHKSKELYGLFEALQANHSLNRLIIVEGYLDVITLHAIGLTEAVATLGTAISLSHIQNLLRFCQSLLFCFDGDLAGEKAAWRALEIALPLMHTGLDLKFLFLPNGEDPDSFARKMGLAGFNQQINQAVPIIDYFFKQLTKDTDIKDLVGKTQFVYQANKYLQKIPTGIFQELMYKRVAQIVGLSQNKVEELLNKPAAPVQKKKQPDQAPRLILPVRLALCLVLQAPRLLLNLDIKPEFYSVQVSGIALLHKIMAIIHKNPNQTTGSLLEYFKEDKNNEFLLELAAQNLVLPENTWQEELLGAIDRILKIDIEERIKQLLALGKNKGLTDDEKKLLQNLLILQKQL
jgi:DNA primase